MGAATFMVYEQQKARKAKLRAKLAKEEADKAKGLAKKKAEAELKKAEKEQKAAKTESKKFLPAGNAKNNKPEDVTDPETHFENGALDLDGDGKPDIMVTKIKK